MYPKVLNQKEGLGQSGSGVERSDTPHLTAISSENDVLGNDGQWLISTQEHV